MCCVLMLATIVGISSGVIILIITAVMVGAYGDADVVHGIYRTAVYGIGIPAQSQSDGPQWQCPERVVQVSAESLWRMFFLSHICIPSTYPHSDN